MRVLAGKPNSIYEGVFANYFKIAKHESKIKVHSDNPKKLKLVYGHLKNQIVNSVNVNRLQKIRSVTGACCGTNEIETL